LNLNISFLFPKCIKCNSQYLYVSDHAIYSIPPYITVVVAQSVRALVPHAEGRKFETQSLNLRPAVRREEPLGRGLCWWTVSPWGSLHSPVAKYFGTCLKIRMYIKLSSKKSKFHKIISKRRISPSCIALSFDGFGSISWHIIWFYRLFYTFHNFFFFGFPTFSAWVPLRRLN
jgi:hypothetical protein